MREPREYFDEKPETGMQIFWYPKAIVDETTIPVLGWVNYGYSKGIANITVLPNQDGSVETREHVFHIGDPRLYDSYGKISPGGCERGCWDFSPTSKAVMAWMAAPAVEEAEPVSEAKKPVNKNTKATK